MRLEDPRTADEGRSVTGEHGLFTRAQQRRLAGYKIKFCCGRLGREFTDGHQQHPPAGTATGSPCGSMRQSANSGAGVG